MARKIDFVKRIEQGNEPVYFVLDSEHEYRLKRGKSVVFMMMAIFEDENMKEAEMFDKFFTLTLGKEACDYINEQDYPVDVCTDMVDRITAELQGSSVEEVKETRKVKKK